MGIPTHKQWMQDTAAGFTSPRSPRLKALDDAIMQYDKTKNPKETSGKSKMLLKTGNATRASPGTKAFATIKAPSPN